MGITKAMIKVLNDLPLEHMPAKRLKKSNEILTPFRWEGKSGVQYQDRTIDKMVQGGVLQCIYPKSQIVKKESHHNKPRHEEWNKPFFN